MKPTTPKNNPPQKNNKNLKQELMPQEITVAQSWAGPLPPAAVLEHYEDIVSGAADRIIQMAENEAKHRHSMDKDSMALAQKELDIRNNIAQEESQQSKEYIKQRGQGQNFGFIIAIIGIVAGTTLIATGHEIGGSVIGGIPLIGLVGRFISQKHSKQVEK